MGAHDHFTDSLIICRGFKVSEKFVGAHDHFTDSLIICRGFKVSDKFVGGHDHFTDSLIICRGFKVSDKIVGAHDHFTDEILEKHSGGVLRPPAGRPSAARRRCVGIKQENLSFKLCSFR